MPIQLRLPVKMGGKRNIEFGINRTSKMRILRLRLYGGKLYNG